MKTLLPILNRIILAFGLLAIASPVLLFGGMDKAPDYVIVPCMLLAFVWFGMYLFGFQKVFKNIFKKKNTVYSPTERPSFDAYKDVVKVRTLKNIEVSQHNLRKEVDINKEAIRETLELRIKLFIVIAVITLIYISYTVKF